MTVEPLGDAALLVTCAPAIGAEATARVLAVESAIRDAAWPGVTAVVPGYTTVLVHFDPRLVDPVDLTRQLASLQPRPVLTSPREWHIPVVYDGEDLADVASHLHISAERLIHLHSEPLYTVACLGFAPGFGYLMGLPAELHVPRRSQPRPQIQAGAVILGGQQTAVMPVALPSGWHVLGRTDWRLFDPAATPPVLLLPGDRVRFVPSAMLAVAA